MPDTPTENNAASQPLHPSTVERVGATRVGLSLDWWAVIAAALLAILVLTGTLPNISW